MSAKFVFLLLTASLLVQCSFGKPLADNAASNSDESSSEGEDPGAMELLDFILKEFSEMADFALEKFIMLLEDVVVELSAMEDNSMDFMKKVGRIAEIRDIIKEVGPEMPKDIQAKILVLTDLKDWLQRIKTVVEPCPEDTIILTSLQKNGMETLKKELQNNFSDFLVRFYEAADKFWNTLSPEKQIAKKAFAEWLEKLKKETNVEQHMEMFNEPFIMERMEGKEQKEGKEGGAKE